jgi:hypothetical protein
VRDHRPLGPAGRPRGVAEHGDVVAAGRIGPRKPFGRAREPVGQAVRPFPGGAVNEEGPDSLKTPDRSFRRRESILVRNEERASGVRQEIFDLLGPVVRVEGQGDRADRENGKMADS